ncbi:dihydrofolate reductase [Yunchengibacter salinarum]|uniref:dihydrofolate reductase n=1 Tax=Yunchengibacter salinarum TaxID=3133399 RepID=UPI0035B5DA2F
MTVSLIAARARDNVIGQDGAMPWHLPRDLSFFKQATLGKPVLMGRRTYQSIGRPLPKRDNFVVSGRADFQPEGVRVFRTLPEGLAAARAAGAEVMVIGGATLYEALLPSADRLYLTDIDLSVPGDTFFPAFDEGDWAETERHPHPAEGDRPAFTIRVLDRRA